VATALNRAGRADLEVELLGHISSEITRQHYIEPDEMVNPVTVESRIAGSERATGALRRRVALLMHLTVARVAGWRNG
jgi:hypothetical protein